MSFIIYLFTNFFQLSKPISLLSPGATFLHYQSRFRCLWEVWYFFTAKCEPTFVSIIKANFVVIARCSFSPLSKPISLLSPGAAFLHYQSRFHCYRQLQTLFQLSKPISLSLALGGVIFFDCNQASQKRSETCLKRFFTFPVRGSSLFYLLFILFILIISFSYFLNFSKVSQKRSETHFFLFPILS